MEEENHKILEFSRQQQDREQKRMAERKEQEEAIAAVQQQVGLYSGGCVYLIWYAVDPPIRGHQ